MSAAPLTGAPFTGAARRITGVLALAFGASLVVSMALAAGRPGNDATGPTVELFVIDHYHRLQAGLAVALISGAAFALFAGALASRLRRADDATGDVWAPCFGVGAAGAVALQLAAAAVEGAYQGLSHSGAVPQEVLELFRLGNGLAAAGGALLAVALAAAGISGLLNGTVPVPLSWLAFLGAVSALVGVGGVVTARTAFGLIGTASEVIVAVWALGLGVWFLARPEEGLEPAAPRPA